MYAIHKLFNFKAMHPSIKILLFLLGIGTINWLSPRSLIFVAIVIIFFAIGLAATSFMGLLSRMIVFFLSIVLIYAFLTPGEYIPFAGLIDQTMVTYEGVIFGALQVLRLVLVLALMSIAFNQMQQRHFLYGLSVLLKPLNTCKLQTDKFIARVDLTMRYAEHLLKNPKSMTLQHFHNLDLAFPTMQAIDLDFSGLKQSLSLIDYVVIASVILVSVVFFGLMVTS